MNLRDIEAQAKALAPILRDYVAKAIESATEIVDVKLKVFENAFYQKIAEIPEPKDGKDGIDGKDADAIPYDVVEKMVADAVEKAIAAFPGVKDGINGKDALEIDILPRIDESKSYTRGTFATHNGGLWRSHSNTEGMRGWECIVDGVASYSIEQVDERHIMAVSIMASGKAHKKAFSLPTMIYRNVWREGSYQKGDVVTFGGCVWHCDEDTDTKPGDGAKHWTLAVKKGRDGKTS